jgi:hypothetical protein
MRGVRESDLDLLRRFAVDQALPLDDAGALLVALSAAGQAKSSGRPWTLDQVKYSCRQLARRDHSSTKKKPPAKKNTGSAGAWLPVQPFSDRVDELLEINQKILSLLAPANLADPTLPAPAPLPWTVSGRKVGRRVKFSAVIDQNVHEGLLRFARLRGLDVSAATHTLLWHSLGRPPLSWALNGDADDEKPDFKNSSPDGDET